MTDKPLEFYVLASDVTTIEQRLVALATWTHVVPYTVYKQPYGENGARLTPKDMRSQQALQNVLNAKDCELYYDAFPQGAVRTTASEESSI